MTIPLRAKLKSRLNASRGRSSQNSFLQFGRLYELMGVTRHATTAESRPLTTI